MHASKTDIIIKQAEPVILPQVKRFFREQGFRAQAPKADKIFIATSNSKIVGALRLCPIDQFWLLRSMCIHESWRGQGIGSLMLSRIRDTLEETRCYCLAYAHLEDFYKRAGFTGIADEAAPPAISKKLSECESGGRKIKPMQFNVAP